MNKRVVITGIGAASVCGFGKDALVTGVMKGEGSFRRLSGGIYGESFQGIYGILDEAGKAEYEGRYLTEAELSLGPCCRLALAAAAEAVTDSGLRDTAEDISPDECGVSIGTTHGEMHMYELAAGEAAARGSVIPQLTAVPHDMIARAVAKKLGWSGECLLHTEACASGNIAVDCGAMLIRSGRLKRVAAGGVELCSELSEASFTALRAVSKDRVRPFDSGRDGIILSEGAAVLILEELETALARGAHIYGEIAGSGQSCDAYSIASMDPEATGIVRAMERACASSGIKPEDIDYICLHGTGTAANDACEMKAIAEFFGEGAGNVRASSVKGTLGHSLGAAAALELAVCASSLESGMIPPNTNLKEPDPQCSFRLVTEPEMAMPEVILNSAYAFGGSNSCILLRKYEGEGK
ncbi:beta-ketoacyl-[acyl-carrier-protein] synthase family protein [Ruminococcus sp.]|uniref:beta-ketoacyl-[acyl-carrier-protein] synthase family protein n=1 Tax=Ruminococcus sp. TaxID=41978 RepID=UPI002CCAAE8F|nr:beta-ketoacyl-[acyl-carrier-protein] synthase family protein [Ruminococcus sp.]HNZ99588.1 beta-ketoacyl-[acyl-carrier-protein] synthase family protein [Ruminococcus sp.]HOH86350.1 beta-ketoacyl-[acyl-carrier-protein] synthase family protein [Ruminococcus sp.]